MSLRAILGRFACMLGRHDYEPVPHADQIDEWTIVGECRRCSDELLMADIFQQRWKPDRAREFIKQTDEDRLKAMYRDGRLSDPEFEERAELLAAAEAGEQREDLVERIEEETNEQSGLWGTRSVTWKCDECGETLHSPSDFELVQGEPVCWGCSE